MGAVIRGAKNIFRNFIRSLSIILILSIAFGLALIMLVSYYSVQNKIQEIKSSVGNIITVTPAGVRGFEGGGELLTTEQVKNIESINHVSSVSKVLQDRLINNQNTTLQPSLEPGSFGRRQQEQGGGGDRNMPGRSFIMSIMVIGIDNLSNIQSLGVGQFKITSGQKFDARSEELVSLVGIDLANKNNLKTSSFFSAYNNNIKVLGIYDTGNKFFNNSIIMPLRTVQNLSGQSGQISSVIVSVDSIDHLSEVQSTIKGKLGDKADIVSSEEMVSSTIRPLENIKTIALYSLLGALVAGIAIVFLTMLLIVRERRKEIGILKAIGASNFKIILQFVSESIMLSLLGGLIGIVLGVLLSNPIVKIMVQSNATAGFEGGPRMGQRIMMIMGNVQTIRNIQVLVGPSIIIYGLLIILAVAIIGSAIPTFLIAKIPPAEAIKNE